MLFVCSVAALAFQGHSGLVVNKPRASVAAVRPCMITNPLDAAASPLRKWEVAAGAGGAAIQDQGNPLTDLPIEVVALFGVIAFVGVAGLVKNSGALDDAAPTVELGQSRSELQEEAAAVQEMSQADKEKRYFKEIAGDLSNKRGGSKAARKKKKKK